MNSDLQLRVLAAVADYFLKTTLAFAVCVLLSRLIPWPKRRLTLWLSFLFGAAGYWLWLACDVFKASRPVANATPGSFDPRAPAVGIWHLPGSWGLPLGITMRAAGIVYLTVLLYFFLRYVINWWRLMWVMKFTTNAPAVIHQRFQNLANGLGVGRSRLLVLSGVSSPATFGWIRPTVLLPDACLEQDPPDLDDILLHELHHVRRWDFVWSRLATACRALVFFQPACWYAMRRLNLERELACDLAVVAQAPERRATYAECLIHFARLHAAQHEKVWGIDFAAPQHLKLRVRTILAGSQKLPVWSVCLRAACGGMLLTGFVGVVPSLAVLLAYTQQLAQPVNHGLIEAPLVHATKTAMANRRLTKSKPSQIPAGTLTAGQGASEAHPLTSNGQDAAGSMVVGSAVTSNPSSPQLQHRPSPNAEAGSSGQQTIGLLDPDITKGNSNAADRKQALEQSATTALGIYRRLGAVDRH